jgi:multiple sugar transport system substrate-binding protein
MRFYTSKTFAAAATAALLLPAIAAPGAFAQQAASKAKAPVTLIWFMRTDPKEVPWEKSEVAAWEKIQPNIHINLITAPNPNGQFDLKFNQLLQSGTPADIWSHLGQAGFADYYHRGLLLNLSPYIKQVGYSFGATPLNLVNTYNKGGNIYGIPSITLGSYLYYNKDIFDAYNQQHPNAKIPYPPASWNDPSWTWAKMISEAKLLTGVKFKTATGTATSYGFLDGTWPPNADLLLNGTDLFTPKDYATGAPAKINLDNPTAIQTFTTEASYFNTLKISPPYSKVKAIGNTGGDPFQFGNVAMYMTGGWGFRNYLSANFHWAAAAFPLWKTRTDVLFTDPYMVYKHTKYPVQAMEFIKFLTNPQSMASYIKMVGFTPANPADLTTWYDQYSKITGMSVADLQTLVAGARANGKESMNHLIDNSSQFINTWQTYIDKIYYGQGTAASVLPQAQTALNAIVAQNSM